MILHTKKFGKLERWIWTDKRNTIHFQLEIIPKDPKTNPSIH